MCFNFVSNSASSLTYIVIIVLNCRIIVLWRIICSSVSPKRALIGPKKEFTRV